MILAVHLSYDIFFPVAGFFFPPPKRFLRGVF